MSIKKDYIEKTKEKYMNKTKKWLEKLKEDLGEIEGWKAEIELTKEKINSYKENMLGFKTGGKTFDLNSILESDQATISWLESKILTAEFNLKEVKAYLKSKKLSDDEKKCIELKYIDEDLTEIKKISFRAIGGIMNCSGSNAWKFHESAIEKISKCKYKIEIETELKQNWNELGTNLKHI